MAGVASRPVALTTSARTRRRAGLWPASPGITTRASARRAVGAMSQTTPLWAETSEVPDLPGDHQRARAAGTPPERGGHAPRGHSHGGWARRLGAISPNHIQGLGLGTAWRG